MLPSALSSLGSVLCQHAKQHADAHLTGVASHLRGQASCDLPLRLRRCAVAADLLWNALKTLLARSIKLSQKMHQAHPSSTAAAGTLDSNKSDFFTVCVLQVKKAELEKRKNDDEQEEGWVQCDLCSAWVHMICGLFNKGRNNEEMPYHCPECLLGGEFCFPRVWLAGQGLSVWARSATILGRLDTDCICMKTG